MTKALATGMRGVVSSLTQCPHWSATDDDPYAIAVMESDQSPASTAPSPKQLLPSEVAVLSDYLIHGMRMIDVLRVISKDGQLYLRGWVTQTITYSFFIKKDFLCHFNLSSSLLGPNRESSTQTSVFSSRRWL